MPSRREADHRLEEAVAALARSLTASGAPWMVIGGIAVIVRGVRRLTTDVDACVRGDALDIASLMSALGREDIHPRIDDAAAFAERNLVLLARHEPSGVDLDISLGWSLFEHEALAEATDEIFGEVRAPMARAEDLVIFKVLAARPRDLEDAEALLLLHDVKVARVRRRVAELADLAGDDEMPESLEVLLRKVRRAKAGARRRRRDS